MTGHPLDGVPAPEATPAEPPAGPSDPELIRETRAGETSPFGVLRARHDDAVRRLARALVASRRPVGSPAEETDEQATSAAVERIVAEVFAGLHTSLHAGNGPEIAFRGHALATTRRVFAESRRDPQQVADLPDTAARQAFAALPERWQVVLWHIEVDGESPEQVAALLGLTATAVVALTHRAHQRLRETYAAALLPGTAGDACRRAAAATATEVDPAAAREAKAHRSDCEQCQASHGALSALRADPAMTLAEALLGDDAPAYLGRSRRRGPTVASQQLARWSAAVGTAVRRGTGRVGSRRAAAGAAIIATAGVVTAVTLAALAVTSPTDPPSAAPHPTDAAADTTPSGPSASSSGSGTPSASGSPSPSSPSPSQTSTSPASSPRPPSPSPPPPPAPTPRLEITSAGQQGDLIAGGSGALTVTVRNTGTRAAALVQLRLDLPRGFSLAANDAGDGWTCTGSNGVTCTRTLLGAGAASTAVVYVKIERHASGRHVVGASVESGSARDSQMFVVNVRRKGGDDH